jgi:hypothetical protein
MHPLVERKAIALMKAGKTITKYELAKEMPCHLIHAHRVLKQLHADRLSGVCIDHWVPINKQPIPAYRIKEGEDAPRPVPKRFRK